MYYHHHGIHHDHHDLVENLSGTVDAIVPSAEILYKQSVSQEDIQIQTYQSPLLLQDLKKDLKACDQVLQKSGDNNHRWS